MNGHSNGINNLLQDKVKNNFKHSWSLPHLFDRKIDPTSLHGQPCLDINRFSGQLVHPSQDLTREMVTQRETEREGLRGGVIASRRVYRGRAIGHKEKCQPFQFEWFFFFSKIFRVEVKMKSYKICWISKTNIWVPIGLNKGDVKIG